MIFWKRNYFLSWNWKVLPWLERLWMPNRYERPWSSPACSRRSPANSRPFCNKPFWASSGKVGWCRWNDAEDCKNYRGDWWADCRNDKHGGQSDHDAVSEVIHIEVEGEIPNANQSKCLKESIGHVKFHSASENYSGHGSTDVLFWGGEECNHLNFILHKFFIS